VQGRNRHFNISTCKLISWEEILLSLKEPRWLCPGQC